MRARVRCSCRPAGLLPGPLAQVLVAGAVKPQGFDVIRRKAHARALERASIEAIERIKRADINELEVGPVDMRAGDWGCRVR